MFSFVHINTVVLVDRSCFNALKHYIFESKRAVSEQHKQRVTVYEGPALNQGLFEPK